MQKITTWISSSKSLAIVPIAFLALASGCKPQTAQTPSQPSAPATPGTPSQTAAGFADIYITVVASDGTTPLNNQEVILQSAPTGAHVDPAQSTFYSDQNGHTHLRLEFDNPTFLSGPVEIDAAEGCPASECPTLGKVIIPNVKVGDSLNITLVTTIPPSPQSQTPSSQKKALSTSGETPQTANSETANSGILMFGPNSPSHYIPVQSRAGMQEVQQDAQLSSNGQSLSRAEVDQHQAAIHGVTMEGPASVVK